MTNQTTVVKVEVENRIQREITELSSAIQRRMKELAVLVKINDMVLGVDMTCVSYTDITVYSDGASTFTMQLSEEHKNARLAAALARKLGVTFEKEQNWTGESLDAIATVDGITFVVRGYVPTTCKIIEETTEISEADYQARVERAIANVDRVNVTRKIVCK